MAARSGAQQPERMQRLGVLMGRLEGDTEGQARLAAFWEQFQKLGWMEGRTIRVDIRWQTSEVDSIQRFSKELVALQPDLIISQRTPTTAALLQQTRTVPIIFVNVVDPIGSGFVASFPRPGGNVTGFILMEPTMAGKWLELLKEIAPRVNSGRLPVQPRNRALCGILPQTLQNRRCVLCGGSDRRARARHVRA